MDEVLTFEETRKYLKLSKSKLYQLVQKRKIPASKIGRIWRFRKAKIDEWLDKKVTEAIKVKDEPLLEHIDKKDITRAGVTLEGIKISLRSRIKQYQKKAQEIKEYLFKQPDQWGKFQEEFNSKLNYIFRQIMEYEKEQVSLGRKDKVQKLKDFFIKKFRKSVFMHGVYGSWSIVKPLGYPGDYKIIDDIYQNNPTTTGFDRLFDNYFQMSAISIAVRNRKEDFKKIIINLAQRKPNENLRIMDIASGSCREIKEIICLDGAIIKNIVFDCYDHEEKAITSAKKLLDGSSNLNFIKGNILRLCLANDINAKIKEKYDMIYATGFFDYLSHRVCIKLIHNLRKLLKENGIIAISNVREKYSNPSVHYMEWAGGWDLIYRTDEEFKKIFIEGGFNKDQLQIQYEQQGIMQYIIAANSKGPGK